MSDPELPPPIGNPQVAEAPPTIADDVLRALDPRYISLSRVIGAIVTAGLFLATLVGWVSIALTSSLPRWASWLILLLGLTVTAFLGWVFYRWPVLEHRHHAYRVNGQGIEIRQGVWWRKVINVPRSRVQHTDVSQGPLERRFGLATLHIHTAGTEEARVDIPGLDHATALSVRDHLVAHGGGGTDDAV